jgi:cutinase
MTMGLQRVVGRLCAAALFAGVLAGTPFWIPPAAGQGCPDIEVVFARGMGDAPGPGPVGQAFVDSLGSRVGGRSVGLYSVNYPASANFLTVSDGVTDATNHVNYMISNCPATRLVLGGFSEGAAVIDYLVGAGPNLSAIPGVGAIPAIPAIPGIPGVGAVPGLDAAPGLLTGGAPLPPEANEHVAAVAVFGNPLDKTGPLNAMSPAYGPKTIDLCHADDPICGEGKNMDAHHLYVPVLTNQAADFVAGRL